MGEAAQCSRCENEPKRPYHKWGANCLKAHSKARYRRLHRSPRVLELETFGYKKSHPLYKAVQSARYRAKRDGLPFNLVLWELSVPEVCPVLGIPMDSRDMQHAPSLDRHDSTKGYTKDNVRVISFRANSIKQDATPEELQRVADYARAGL